MYIKVLVDDGRQSFLSSKYCKAAGWAESASVLFWTVHARFEMAKMVPCRCRFAKVWLLHWPFKSKVPLVIGKRGFHPPCLRDYITKEKIENREFQVLLFGLAEFWDPLNGQCKRERRKKTHGNLLLFVFFYFLVVAICFKKALYFHIWIVVYFKEQL